MEEAREARRKKLMNRGTDRLAFITGQSRSLPPPPPPPAADSITTKTQAGNQISGIKPENEGDRIEQAPTIAPEIKPSNEENSRTETVNEPTKRETGSHRKAGTLTTSSLHTATRNVFSPKKISASISASENIRLICSVIIAFLVVFLYHGSGINLRPLLLALLTDITIVFGRIMLNNQGNENKAEEESRSKIAEGDGTVNIGDMLEVAMLAQKAFCAFSMDLSICAVIVICGIVI